MHVEAKDRRLSPSFQPISTNGIWECLSIGHGFLIFRRSDGTNVFGSSFSAEQHTRATDERCSGLQDWALQRACVRLFFWRLPSLQIPLTLQAPSKVRCCSSPLLVLPQPVTAMVKLVDCRHPCQLLTHSTDNPPQGWGLPTAVTTNPAVP